MFVGDKNGYASILLGLYYDYQNRLLIEHMTMNRLCTYCIYLGHLVRKQRLNRIELYG